MHDQRQYLKQNCINLSKINDQNSIPNAKKKKKLHQQNCNLFTQGWVSQNYCKLYHKIYFKNAIISDF